MFDKITFNAADTSTWPQLILNGTYYSSIDKPNLTTDGKYGAGLTWVGVNGRDISVYGELGSPKYVNDLDETVSGSFVTYEDQEKFWGEGQMSNFTFVNSKGGTDTVTLNWGEALADGGTLPAEENNDKEEPKPIEGGGDDPAELEDGEKPKDGPMENAPTTGKGMETFVKNLNEKMSAAYQKANELESLINKQRDILKKANSFSDDFTARKENIQVISEDIESKRKTEVEELTKELDTEHSKGVVINERMSEKVLDIDARKAELDSAGAGFAEDSEYKYLKERTDRMMLEIDSVKSIRVVDVKSEKKSILEEAKVEKKVIARNPIQTKEEVLGGGTDPVNNKLKTWEGAKIYEQGVMKGTWIESSQYELTLNTFTEHLERGQIYDFVMNIQGSYGPGMARYKVYSGDMDNVYKTEMKVESTIPIAWTNGEALFSLDGKTQMKIASAAEELVKDKFQTLEDNAGDIFPGEE